MSSESSIIPEGTRERRMAKIKLANTELRPEEEEEEQEQGEEGSEEILGVSCIV